MDSTSRSDAFSELPVRAADVESAGAGSPNGYHDSASGILPYLPVSRHRRPTGAELAAESPLANARFVRFTIVCTILFVSGMTALIWYRWYPVTLPTSNIIVAGDESLDGAVATLSRNGLEACSVTIGKEDDYVATAWLSPGQYDMIVSRNNRVIQSLKIVVAPGQSLVDTLSSLAGTSPPPAAGAASKPTSADTVGG